jgi:flagellar P-ring protein precursor FlgI
LAILAISKESSVKSLFYILCFTFIATCADASRIKDAASISGVRGNPLLGYGLVVGLSGTGDQTSQTFFTIQALKNMLNQLGIKTPPGVNLQLKNVAAVMVQAELPAFAKIGQKVDVVVSSVGNSKSLHGGSLVMTPLKGADGNVYAIAQGSLVVGGFGAEGSDGSSVTVNVPSSGRIPNGASVERLVKTNFTSTPTLELNLHTPDFTTAQQLATKINQVMGAGVAVARDNVTVEVSAPTDLSSKVAFVSELENLEFQPGVASARVIINARTGTVVIGRHVKVLTAAVSHGSLTVSIAEATQISQPAPFSRAGETVVAKDSQVVITQENNPMFLFEPGVSLNDLVQAVNKVGASPADLVSILQALKEVGALQAQLIVI